MKKTIFLVYIMAFCVLLSSCTQYASNVSGAKISIGESKIFSKSEIESAIDKVKIKFGKSFTVCKLTDLWYDENSPLVSYEINTGEGLEIRLLSNFTTNGYGPNDGFSANSTYTKFMWILVRESTSDDWTVKDWGY